MAYIDCLRALAHDFESTDHALSNATELASGRTKFLVVLWEPCNSADYLVYDLMLNSDVEDEDLDGCDTLLEVEDLARLMSDGKFGLSDLHVFDVNTLLSADTQEELNDQEVYVKQAHMTFQKMVLALQPDVLLILQCGGRKSSNKFVRLLSSSMRQAGTIDIIKIKSKDAIVVRGFHPSVYLREDYTQDLPIEQVELYRSMLEYCFTVAFEALNGRPHFDKDLLERWRVYHPSEVVSNEVNKLRIAAKLRSLRDIDNVIGDLATLDIKD